MKATRSLCASLFFALPIAVALFLLSSCKSDSKSTPTFSTFTLTVQIAPADTADLMLYVQPEGPYTDDAATMFFDGLTSFRGSCPASAAHFYSITCLKDGGQYIIPLWSPSGSLTIALPFVDGAPAGFAPVEGLTRESEAAGIKVMSDYFRLSADLQRSFWMQMRETDEPTLQDYIGQLARCAEEGCKPKAVNKEVKEYLTAWAYLDGYKMVDNYNRMHEPKADPISLLHKSPTEALDNDIAILQNGAALAAYSTVPKGNLDTRIKFVREQFKTPAIQTMLEQMILDNYLRRYDFNAGVEQGLQELTSAQQTYGIDSTYIEKFRQRMSSAIGAPFPDVAIEDRDGAPVDINTFRGKYLYIDLWASWCVPCIKEVPYLQALEKELKNDKVAFLSISCDTDRDAWQHKMEDLHMHGNQFIDAKGEFCDRLGVTGIPRFLIYDPEGHLLVADAPRPSTPAAREMLEKLQ